MSTTVAPLARKDLGQGQGARHGGRRPQEPQLRANPIVKGLGKDNYHPKEILRGITDMYDMDERRSSPDFRDSKEFYDYMDLIEAVVHLAPEETDAVGTTRPGLMSIRQIHDALDDLARREWTLDALEKLKTVEIVPGLIDKYRRSADAPPVYEKRGWTGNTMGHLFARARGDKDAPIPYGDHRPVAHKKHAY